MIVMNSELELRDKVTKLFSNGEFSQGDTILANNIDMLSDSVKLECLGNRFFYERKLQDAVRCYEEGITLNPSHSMSRYQYLVGTQLLKKGALVDAFKRFQEAIEIAPDFVDPYVDLGSLLVKVEDYNGALCCFQDAFKLDSKDPINVFNLKNILEKLIDNGNVEYLKQFEEVKQLCDHIEPPGDDYLW